MLPLSVRLVTSAACIAAGGFSAWHGAAGVAHALARPAAGMPLTLLPLCGLAAVLLGLGVDLLRPRAREQRGEGLANSVWAAPAHLRKFDVVED